LFALPHSAHFFAFFFVINELLFMPFSYSTDAATNLSRNDKRKHKQTEVTLFTFV